MQNLQKKIIVIRIESRNRKYVNGAEKNLYLMEKDIIKHVVLHVDITIV